MQFSQLPSPLTHKTIRLLIQRGLREDNAFRDVTSRIVIPPTLRIRARIVAKESGVLAGIPMAIWTFQAMDPLLRCVLKVREGSSLKHGQTLLTVEGRARSIFAAERTVLNFLGHLSGIATLTAEYVRRVRGTEAQIFDTRKTLPGLRLLEKYAVRIGGGRNHRTGLGDAVLIKTNHLRALRGATRDKRQATNEGCIETAIGLTNRQRPRSFIEAEVTSMREFRVALRVRPDAILLDNWDLAGIRRAVQIRNSALCTPHSELPLLDVSGGVTLANVRAIAMTGVDRISIGRLTHSAPSLDVSLRVI